MSNAEYRQVTYKRGNKVRTIEVYGTKESKKMKFDTLLSILCPIILICLPLVVFGPPPGHPGMPNETSTPRRIYR